MPATLVNSGVYDAHEVAHLLGRHPEQIVRWSTADSKGHRAIVEPTHRRAFAFVDLVSLAVVAELCARGVSEVDVRAGLRFLEREHGLHKPLAQRTVLETIATSGASFLSKVGGAWYDIGKGGQGAFEQVIRIYLRTVDYDDLGVASVWHPHSLVVLDPRVQAGAPCIAGTRIPTATILDLLEDESAEEIANEYNLTVEQVDAASEFERRLNDGLGLAA